MCHLHGGPSVSFSFFSGTFSAKSIIYKKEKHLNTRVCAERMLFTKNLFYFPFPVDGAKSSRICLHIFEIPGEEIFERQY